MHPLRIEQIQEAMDDLEQIFADPECFGLATNIGDYAESLASEFVGPNRDDEIVSRLNKLIEAEEAGRPRDALRHFGYVRRKVDARLREWWSQIDKKAQLDEGSVAPEALQTPDPVSLSVMAPQRLSDPLGIRVLQGASS